MSQASFELDLDDGGLPTFTVRELAEAINGALRRSFYEGVWVRGEVQGLSERNGHLYFSLVDDGEEGRASIAVSLFANVRFKLRPLLQRHRLHLAEGLAVRIHGYPDLFAPTGRLSLKMSGIDPRYTLGELALQRDDLIRRLVAEGLYDAQSRRTLPAVPLRLGLVTSVGSAAWHDVTDELRASGFGFRVTACDTRVQGEWAAEMVAAAIGTLARRALDVVVVVRGGGARSELATFDSEVVARAIARSPVPVLTGLGHEVDRSVADEVACLALKTPTACAAELVGRVRRFRAAAEEAWTAIGVEVGAHLATAERGLQMTARQAARQTRGSLAVESARLVGHAQRLPRQAGRTLARATAALDVASERSRRRAAHRLEVDSATVAAAAGRLRRRVPALARADAHTLEALESRVRSLDPARALARGWSITRTADGAIVRSTADVAPGDRITTTVADGRVHSRVEDEQERRP